MKTNSSKSTNVFKFLGIYLSPFKRQLIGILFSIFFISSAILGLGYALRFLIDQGFEQKNIHHLDQAFTIFILMIFILSLASYNRSYQVNWICQQLESNIKRDTFKNIIRLTPSYFEINKVSDITSRLTTDLTLVCNTIVMICSFSLRNIIMAFGGIILLCVSSIKLTIYVFAILPLVLLPIVIIGRKTKKLSKKNQNEVANCNAKIEETFNFIKIVQAYNNEDFEISSLNKLILNSDNIAHKRISLRSTLFALVIALVLSSIAIVLWAGGRDVINGNMSAGTLTSFIFYSIIVATSLGGLSEVYSDWQRAAGAIERIIEINTEKSSLVETENPLKLSSNQEVYLSVENITFSYPNRRDAIILDEISFELKNGSTIALVGPSGAGKTTIFQLLLRFYDPNSGYIKMNNVNYPDFAFKDLRSNFALVSQDPIIFSGSAYENILYGKSDATYEQVILAAKSAEIYDYFNSLPDGLHTYIGEKGVQISGGQKQRIAIARAILRDPKILLLDEATSSLDSENERLVQNALLKLRKNRSTIVIAHRISTIVNADLILVIDKGKIVASGKHKELANESSIYKQLCQNYID